MINPMREWTRLAPGTYVSDDYRITRQPTTFGIRRASNPMWFLYQNGTVLGRYRTLALAQVAVRDRNGRSA